MDFGRKFIKARNRKGMEQKDAAALLDISPGFLSKIENNKKRPNIDLILKAAELYSVKPVFFFDDPEDIDIESLRSDKNMQFIQDLEALSDNEIKEKYRIQLDGKELSASELKGIMAYVRSLRSLEE